MSSRRHHLIIDLKEVQTDKLSDSEGLSNFIKNLPGVIGMKILHGPVVVEGVAANPGITAFVIIDFSHISIHTFTETSEALIDIFSCKSFDTNQALQFVLNHFEAKESQATIKQVVNA